jgi:Protein kinase domain
MGCIPSKDSNTASPSNHAADASSANPAANVKSSVKATAPTGSPDDAVAGLSSQGVKFNDAYKIGKEVRLYLFASKCFVFTCKTLLILPLQCRRSVSSLSKQLGAGAFSVVKEGTHKASGHSFAIKVVTKAKLTPEDSAALQDEIAVLQELQHPNIIRLYDVFDEKLYYYLVTEKMSGGELFDRIVQKSYYNEKEARDTCLVLFEALAFCHEHKVAHRDLKPENLLLQVRLCVMKWNCVCFCDNSPLPTSVSHNSPTTATPTSKSPTLASPRNANAPTV